MRGLKVSGRVGDPDLVACKTHSFLSRGSNGELTGGVAVRDLAPVEVEPDDTFRPRNQAHVHSSDRLAGHGIHNGLGNPRDSSKPRRE
jgi:hypothetical protein